MAIQSTPYDYSKAKSNNFLAMPDVNQNIGVGQPGYGGLNTYGSNPNAGGSLVTPVYAAENMLPVFKDAQKAVINTPQTNQGTVLGQTTQQTTPISSNPSTDSGFDMKYYPGWNYTEALADWRATGGSKAKTSGGTGGGDKSVSLRGDVRANQVLGDPTANQDFQNSGMNMDEYLATIDSEANTQNNYLNSQEQNIRADQTGIEQGLSSQADLLRGKAVTGKEDALSAARRLYSELQQGYKQRFGGASSAGEAAMALTGNEQQRQMAQTNRQAQDTIAQIDQQASQALQTAQSEFRSRLDQINQNRTLVESQRLTARRQVLADLSQKAYAIKQQQDTFKQNILQMMAQQDASAGKNISSYLNVNPTTTLTPGAVATTASGNQGLSNAVGYKGSTGTSSNLDYLRSLGLVA